MLLAFARQPEPAVQQNEVKPRREAERRYDVDAVICR